MSDPLSATSAASPDPALPVAPTADFSDVKTEIQADEKDVIKGAIQYLEGALETAKTQSVQLEHKVADDAEALAFKVATERGFAGYLSMFKSTIDAGKDRIEASIALETAGEIDKGIAKLKLLL